MFGLDFFLNFRDRSNPVVGAYLDSGADAFAKIISKNGIAGSPYGINTAYRGQLMLDYGIRWDVTEAMNIMRHDRLFIRSSLLNTMWKKDGTKSDIICVITLEGSPYDSIKEYLMPGDSGRNYEVKETSTGATSFTLRITDANDNLVEFLDDYELTLGFFFLPATNCVS